MPSTTRASHPFALLAIQWLLMLVPMLGWAAEFTVQGAQLRDPSGAPFVVRGVNVQGMRFGWPDDVALEAGAIASTWGFNAVRVNCFLGTAYWDGQPVSQNSHYQTIASMDALVQAFTSRGVVVIFEWHDRTGGYFEGAALEELKQAMRTLCDRHGSNPYVWYNVMNEPGDGNTYDQARWLAVHRAVISVIRDEKQVTAPIVIDGAAWGQDTHTWNTEPTTTSMILNHAAELKSFGGKTYGNLIFSVHTYGLWDLGTLEQATAKLRNYAERAIAADICLMVGEWGVGDGSFAFERAMRATVQVSQSLGIGRMAWAWGGYDDFDLTLSGNGGGKWVDVQNGQATNLTPFGRLAWDDLRFVAGSPTAPAIILPERVQVTAPAQPMLQAQAVADARPLSGSPTATVSWECLSRPSGATVAFAAPASLSPGMTVDLAGEYLVQLRVATPGGVATARTVVIMQQADSMEYVGNGGFELGLTAWEVFTGTPTITTVNPAAGAQSLAMTGNWTWVQQNVAILEPGETYVLRASGRVAWGAMMVGVKSDAFDQKLAFTTTGGTGWQTLEREIVVPAPRGSWCVLYLGLDGAAEGAFDQISLRKRVTVPAANQAPTVSLTAPAAGATGTAPATFTLAATAADTDGTVAKVEFFAGATKLGEDLSAPYQFSWAGVAAGTYTLTARATDNGGATTTSTAVSVSVSVTAPANPWTSTVIGKVAVPGSTTVDATGVTLVASGADIWGRADAFRFAAQSVTGDTVITAKVDRLDPSDPWAKAGVMLRDGTAAGARNVAMLVTPGNGTYLQRRTNTGGSSARTAGPVWAAPAWVRIERVGQVFTGSVSRDGITWQVVQQITLTLPATLQVGLAATARRTDTTTTTARFSAITIIAAPVASN